MILETLKPRSKKPNRKITTVAYPVKAEISTVPSLEDEWYKVVITYDTIAGTHRSTARFLSPLE